MPARLLSPRIVILTASIGFGVNLHGQTPPTPETTFNQTSSTAWTTAGNWDNGVPTTTGANPLLDAAKIADTRTAVLAQIAVNESRFGTLTLGTNSTLQYQGSGSGGGTGLGGTIYFNNGSHLQYTSGNVNRSASYNILTSASAKWTYGNGDTIPGGTVTGDATTTFELAQSGGNSYIRLDTTAFAGTLNITGNHRFNFTNLMSLGSATTHFDNNARANANQSNRINDSATIKLTGSSGSTNTAKYDMGGASETIGNFVIDSPTGATASAPTVRGSNANALIVSGTTTFQGTAGAVNIDSSLAALTNNVLTTGNMTFGGTGTWAVSGDGNIRLNAASGTRTITTTADASIANNLTGTQGFTKAGAGKLTLSNANTYTGLTNITAGTLEYGVNNAISTDGVTVNGSSAILDLKTFSDTVGTVILDGGGAINSTTGVLTSTADFDVRSGTASAILGGAVGLNKTTGGTVTLTGTSSYTGATVVSEGTLIVDGNISTSSGVTVQSGATLGGTGTVGALTIDSDGVFSPGNSPGITIVAGDYEQNGTLLIEISGLTPGVGGHDQVDVTGTVTLNGALDLQFDTFTPMDGDLILFLLNDGGDAINGTFTGLAEGAVAASYGGFDWRISYLAGDGNDIALLAVGAAVIPEPSTALLSALGLLALMRRRR